jgi:hypothetical protein
VTIQAALGRVKDDPERRSGLRSGGASESSGLEDSLGLEHLVVCVAADRISTLIQYLDLLYLPYRRLAGRALEPVSDFIDAADRVVVRFIWRGAGYGPEANLELTGVYTVRKRRIAFFEFFWDHAEVRETLGRSERAMSRENVELMRTYHDAIARASQEGLDPEAMAEAMISKMAPKVGTREWNTTCLSLPCWTWSGSGNRGLSTVLAREWFASWETFQFEHELVGAGERIVVLLDLRMRGRFTGIEVPFGKHAFVAAIRDGLVDHAKLYMSQSEALEAMGVSEQDMAIRTKARAPR